MPRLAPLPGSHNNDKKENNRGWSIEFHVADIDNNFDIDSDINFS